MHRHRGGDELRAARLVRQQHRARGEHRLERIAAGRERVHGRRDPAQRGGPGGCSENANGPRIGLVGDVQSRKRGERRGACHAARALLRPDLRLRDHAGDGPRRRRPDLGGARQGTGRARRALVVVGRVRLADEHDQPGGGCRPDRDVRGDDGDAGRVAGGPGRLRRRRVPLRVRLRRSFGSHTSSCTRSRAEATATCSVPSRGSRSARAIGVGAPLRRRRARRACAGGRVGARARDRHARRVHRRRQGLASCARSLRRAPRPDRDHRARRVDRRPRSRREPRRSTPA